MIQIRQGWRPYFLEKFINYIDLTLLLFTLIIVVHETLDLRAINQSSINLMASATVFMIWVKCLDSLRAFGRASFYVRLIIETVKDMAFFLSILLFTIVTATIMRYLLQKERVESRDL